MSGHNVETSPRAKFRQMPRARTPTKDTCRVFLLECCLSKGLRASRWTDDLNSAGQAGRPMSSLLTIAVRSRKQKLRERRCILPHEYQHIASQIDDTLSVRSVAKCPWSHSESPGCCAHPQFLVACHHRPREGCVTGIQKFTCLKRGNQPEFVGQSSWKFPEEELSSAGALHSLNSFTLECALGP